MTPSKTCPGCGEVKALDEYGRDAQKSDGLTSRCLPCRRLQSKRSAQSEAAKVAARARHKKWREANPKEFAAAVQSWRERHPDYSAEANRKYREANPGYNAAYHQANRDKTMERVLRRRKRIAESATGPVDLPALWEAQAGTCGICSTPIDSTLVHPDPQSPSVDHIVPLSKGGRHSQDNLQWSHLRCNLSKGARVPVRP